MQMSHGRDVRDKELTARVDLGGQGLVLRRYAAHRIRDGAIDEFKSIIDPLVISPLGEAMPQKRGVEEIAGKVAGKRPTGAVCAVQSRRETDDQKTRAQRTERRNRRIEIVRPRLAIVVTKFGQARAQRTIAQRLGRRHGTQAL